MPTTTIFTTTSFDPASIRQEAIIFNAQGIIDDGGFINPAELGYTAEYMDAFMEDGFAGEGLGWLVYDVSTQFANATYFYAVNEAVTYTNGTTVYYDDNGFQGTAGSDVIWDWAGHNIANTGGGADLIVLGGGTNAVDSGSGNDVIFTGNEVDVVKAGTNDDFVYLHGGDDHAKGDGGRDLIDGGTGADSLWGDTGNDSLYGGDDADMLDGGDAADMLFGDAGNDDLWGMAGTDRLNGGEGDDALRGGNGADRFVFDTASGHDTIWDLNRNQDRLVLDIAATGLGNFAAVQQAASVVAGDVVIALAAGSITIEGLGLNQMTAALFEFV